MKRISLFTALLAFALVLSNSTVFGQKKYFSLNIGYGFGLGQRGIIVNRTDVFNGYVATSTRDNVKFSAGKGLNFGGTLGWVLSENVGIEVGASYLKGDTTGYYGSDKNTSSDSSFSFAETFSVNMFRINPTVVIYSGGTKAKLYTKFGLVLGYGSLMDNYREDDNGDVLMAEIKSTGWSTGFSAGLGITVPLSNKVDFFGEVNMVNMVFTPTKGKFIKETYNGQDVLTKAPVYYQEIEYVDSKTVSSTQAPNTGLAQQQLKQSYPMSAVGLNIGLRFKF